MYADIFWNQCEPELIEHPEWSNVNITGNADNSMDDFDYLAVQTRK